MTSLAFIVAGAISVLYVLRWIYTYRRLRHIPGPLLAGWSKLWTARVLASGNSHAQWHEISKTYGPLARIGPNHLLTSDPEVIRRMNAARSPYKRADLYKVFRVKPRCDNILTTVSEWKHEELRRKMSAGYSGKEVPHMEDVIDKHVRELVDLIKRKYISTSKLTRPMDLAKTIQYFTLDVISDLAFDSPFGDIPEDTDKFAYTKTTGGPVRLMVVLSEFPQVYTFLERTHLLDLLAPSAEDKVGLGPIIGIARQKVAERFDPHNKQERQDMLSSFIKHGLSQGEAESEAVLQVLAGSDTTATAIRVLFLYLLTSPATLMKLKAEIDRGICNNVISSPIRDSQARQLPYLQACIKEALRIWPPVAGTLSKVVPPEGDTINGKFIPGGTSIAPSIWAVGRSESVFGPDPEVFRPERWLESSGEKLQHMERNKELSFSFGRFKCLGQPVALMEMNKVIVEMLRIFDFSIVNPSKPWNSFCAGLFFQREFWVRITDRVHDVTVQA